MVAASEAAAKPSCALVRLSLSEPLDARYLRVTPVATKIASAVSSLRLGVVGCLAGDLYVSNSTSGNFSEANTTGKTTLVH